MTDRLDFESRLGERLRGRASLASRPFDATTIAREAIAASGRHRRIGALAVPSMRPALRWLLVFLLFAMVVLGAVAGAGALLQDPTAVDALATPQTTVPTAAGWTVTGSMTRARGDHSATLLPDGRVLVAGGSAFTPASAEIYDPGTGSWSATGDMTVGRPRGHTATLLPDGTVLVVGGDVEDNAIKSAELYDPGTETWTATGAMVEPHGRGHTATLLPDGRVLVAGGITLGRDARPPKLASAELYDPVTRSWSTTGTMSVDRYYHTATLLPDGTVLVAGSVHSSSSAELYDPTTGSWTVTGSMHNGRHDFTATLLTDGTVLVAAYEGHNGAELYDPSTGVWAETGSMAYVRVGRYTATLLRDGTVLVAGGVPNKPWLAELYDPRTRAWAAAPETGAPRESGTATLLPDGTVLVAGGRGGSTTAQLYSQGVKP